MAKNTTLKQKLYKPCTFWKEFFENFKTWVASWHHFAGVFKKNHCTTAKECQKAIKESDLPFEFKDGLKLPKDYFYKRRHKSDLKEG